MKSTNPYLFFNKTQCKAAMQFYQGVFGGELNLVEAGKMGPGLPPGADPNSIMHALLHSPMIRLMASDNGKNDTAVGDNVCIYLECSNRKEMDELFSKLSRDGEVAMAPEKTFWGAYFGSLTDRFGVSWMLSSEI